MAFRADRGIRGVDNLGIGEVLGGASLGVPPRGESHSVRRSGIRRRRWRAWRDGESRASLALHNVQARVPASVPDSRAQCASAALPYRQARVVTSQQVGWRASIWWALLRLRAIRSDTIPRASGWCDCNRDAPVGRVLRQSVTRAWRWCLPATSLAAMTASAVRVPFAWRTPACACRHAGSARADGQCRASASAAMAPCQVPRATVLAVKRRFAV